ncbi:hypothetical protein FJZ27_04435 [Candidatus Peribacteria bacterium]|nr:hypothetical protein [Candidatus Peribacteria bacterium]
MPRTFTAEAIVLATYNVGEADRLCVLFTRDYGRIAARATAARRVHSKLGGTLLPFLRIRADIREWKGGYVITGAHRHVSCMRGNAVEEFLAAAEVVELLLILLEDGEPLPELFDALTEALASTSVPPAFHAARMLHLLGHMPAIDATAFPELLEQERRAIALWIQIGQLLDVSPNMLSSVSALCERVLRDHGNRKRRVPEVRQAFAVAP